MVTERRYRKMRFGWQPKRTRQRRMLPRQMRLFGFAFLFLALLLLAARVATVRSAPLSMIGAHWGMLSVGRSCVSGRSAGVRFAVGSPKILLAVEIFGRVLVRMFSTLLCSGSNAVFGHSAGFVFSFSRSRYRPSALCPLAVLLVE